MVNQPSETTYVGGEIDARIQMAVEKERRRIVSDLEPLMEEALEISNWSFVQEYIRNLESNRICCRCGVIRTDNVDSDICGSCADELRSEMGGGI